MSILNIVETIKLLDASEASIEDECIQVERWRQSAREFDDLFVRVLHRVDDLPRQFLNDVALVTQQRVLSHVDEIASRLDERIESAFVQAMDEAKDVVLSDVTDHIDQLQDVGRAISRLIVEKIEWLEDRVEESSKDCLEDVLSAVCDEAKIHIGQEVAQSASLAAVQSTIATSLANIYPTLVAIKGIAEALRHALSLIPFR